MPKKKPAPSAIARYDNSAALKNHDPDHDRLDECPLPVLTHRYLLEQGNFRNAEDQLRELYERWKVLHAIGDRHPAIEAEATQTASEIGLTEVRRDNASTIYYRIANALERRLIDGKVRIIDGNAWFTDVVGGSRAIRHLPILENHVIV